MKIRNLLTSAVLAAVIAPAAHATQILGASLVVAQTGNVTAQFLGSDAAYADLLFLDAATDTFVFNNHLSTVGATVDLGTFTAGTELIFRIDVYKNGVVDGTPDSQFFSGNGSLNADHIAHAMVETNYLGTSATYVGFEDILNGGDHDYNDIKYSFTNLAAVQTGTVPEPSAIALLGAGLIGLGIARRRKA